MMNYVKFGLVYHHYFYNFKNIFKGISFCQSVFLGSSLSVMLLFVLQKQNSLGLHCYGYCIAGRPL